MDEPDENNIEREVTEVRLFYVQILENNFLTASESDSWTADSWACKDGRCPLRLHQ